MNHILFQSPIVLSKQTRKQCEVRQKHNIKQIIHISNTMKSVVKHDIKLLSNYMFDNKVVEENI